MASESLINQLSKSFYNADGTPNERLDKYCSQDVTKIIIDGNEFTGYKTYSFFWEKTYVKEPTRGGDGTIGNLNSYATFITPHLQIKFSLMSMEDYRRLYDLILSRNEFVVTCYNPLTNEVTTNKMYFYPDSMPKLNMIARNIFNGGQREKWTELLGVQDYTIEMVGTNAQLGDLIVQYQPNVPSGVSSSLTGIAINVANGQQILVGNGAESIMNSTFLDIDGNKWVFSHWNTLETPTEENKGNNYAKDKDLFIHENTTLYAQWKTTNDYVLSYNYGLGEPKVGSNGEAINSKSISIGESVGELYQSTTPTVNFDGNTYDNAYEWKGWYWNSKGIGDKVTSTTKYNISANTTIYQIFEPREYTLTFNSNGGTQIESITNKFDTAVAIPIPKKDGYTFKGWYYDDKFTKKFGGAVPPKNATLYAKWEESK